MAEGDSILRIARRLDGAIAGGQVTVRAPGRRRPEGLPPAELDGRVLERVESRGKHLLFHFEGGLALHSHLGMRGSWRLYSAGERWNRPRSQAWIALAGRGMEAVNFGGPTMRITRETRLRADPRLARLGADILAEGFEPEAAVRALRRAGQATELGEALIDQSLVAGIGNIFKSEGCFEARIDPRSRIGALGDEELASVLDSTRGLMLAAVETARQPSRVYRRAGRPCPRCGAAIQSKAQGDSARISYWCPSCQTLPRAVAGPAERPLRGSGSLGERFQHFSPS